MIAKIAELKAKRFSVRAMLEYLENHGYRNRAGNPFGAKEVWKIAKAA